MQSESKEKIKKERTTGIVESFDNTASVDKITAFLEAKRKVLKVYNYVSCLKRQQRQASFNDILEHFTFPGHPLCAYSNTWDGGLPTGYFEKLSHKSMLPCIINEPLHIGEMDPVTKILEDKIKWKHKSTSFKMVTKAGGKKTKPYRWINDDVLHCPKYFIELAAHLENDPDPFHASKHNWYYAGSGNMITTSINGTDYIIHSDLNCLHISQLFKDTMSIDHKNRISYKCEDNIFETVQMLNYIALRSKHKIIILRLVGSEEGMQIEKVKEIKSELPYTSISFDEYHKNILYITTLDFMLTIVNLDRMTCRKLKLKGKFLSLIDNWNSVVGAEREYFLHVSDNALTFYDKRTNKPVQRWKSLKYQSDLVLCNKNLATKYCQGKPLMYLGTTHHLFLMDMRYNSTTKPKSIMRWTHGMRSKLTHIDVGPLENNKDVVCMTSQWAPDMCYLSNYSDILTRYTELNSVTVPYRPPDLLETYNQAQRKGLCCNLYEPIIDRLMMSVTGVSVVQGDESPRILLQNSLGDISCYSLYPEHMAAFIEDDGVEQLYEWTTKLKWEEKPVEVTYVYDISKLWNNLKRIPDSYELGYQRYIKRRHNFNEQEIFDTFENGDVDSAFLEAWKDKDEMDDEITLNHNEPEYRDLEATNMELSDDEF